MDLTEIIVRNQRYIDNGLQRYWGLILKVCDKTSDPLINFKCLKKLNTHLNFIIIITTLY